MPAITEYEKAVETKLKSRIDAIAVEARGRLYDQDEWPYGRTFIWFLWEMARPLKAIIAEFPETLETHLYIIGLASAAFDKHFKEK
jgi:hypothetical protein